MANRHKKLSLGKKDCVMVLTTTTVCLQFFLQILNTVSVGQTIYSIESR